MIELRNLIEHLPPYFREFDTYKDDEGKGILERFLTLPGDYLRDEIMSTIEGIPNIVDIDTTDEELLNFIWEILGAIPYSQSQILDNTLNEVYKIPNKTKAWKKTGDKEKPRPTRLRELINYTIHLYKIKGSLEFYPNLLKFYGYLCKVYDPTGDLTGGEPQHHIDGDEYHYDMGYLYDESYTYDKSRIPPEVCIEVKLHITTGHELSSKEKERLLRVVNLYRPVYIEPFTDINVTFDMGGFPYTLPHLLS